MERHTPAPKVFSHLSLQIIADTHLTEQPKICSCVAWMRDVRSQDWTGRVQKWSTNWSTPKFRDLDVLTAFLQATLPRTWTTPFSLLNYKNARLGTRSKEHLETPGSQHCIRAPFAEGL